MGHGKYVTCCLIENARFRLKGRPFFSPFLGKRGIRSFDRTIHVLHSSTNLGTLSGWVSCLFCWIQFKKRERERGRWLLERFWMKSSRVREEKWKVCRKKRSLLLLFFLFFFFVSFAFPFLRARGNKVFFGSNVGGGYLSTPKKILFVYFSLSLIYLGFYI